MSKNLRAIVYLIVFPVIALVICPLIGQRVYEYGMSSYNIFLTWWWYAGYSILVGVMIAAAANNYMSIIGDSFILRIAPLLVSSIVGALLYYFFVFNFFYIYPFAGSIRVMLVFVAGYFVIGLSSLFHKNDKDIYSSYKNSNYNDMRKNEIRDSKKNEPWYL